jgi:hypothetical protein
LPLSKLQRPGRNRSWTGFVIIIIIKLPDQAIASTPSGFVTHKIDKLDKLEPLPPLGATNPPRGAWQALHRKTNGIGQYNQKVSIAAAVQMPAANMLAGSQQMQHIRLNLLFDMGWQIATNTKPELYQSN